MKKVLTILVVLTLVAGFAFADAPAPTPSIVQPKVTLTTSIGEIAPAFKLYYNNGSKLLTGTQTANGSITTTGITANFEIWQEGEVDNKTYSNYGIAAGTAVSLTVTCGAFEGTDTGKNTGYASATPKASALANGATQKDAQNADTLTYGAFAGDNTNEVTFQPTYHGKRVNDQKIASFTATWAADSSLPFGNYEADITLAFTAD